MRALDNQSAIYSQRGKTLGSHVLHRYFVVVTLGTTLIQNFWKVKSRGDSDEVLKSEFNPENLLILGST